MIIIAIDPGNIQSGFCVYDSQNKKIIEAGILENDAMITFLYNIEVDHVVIEMVACYGMPVGATVFDTCVWIGRFRQVINKRLPHSLMFRRDVKLHLCNSVRAKDSNISQALLDRFGYWEHGKTGKGTKDHPGPLYGFKSDMWAALAIAVTFAETLEN